MDTVSVARSHFPLTHKSSKYTCTPAHIITHANKAPLAHPQPLSLSLLQSHVCFPAHLSIMSPLDT